jgi:hypothetical protein
MKSNHEHASRGQLRSCEQCTPAEKRIDAAAAHTMDKAYRGAYTVRPAAIARPMDIVVAPPSQMQSYTRQAQRAALAGARLAVNTDPKRVRQFAELQSARAAIA